MNVCYINKNFQFNLRTSVLIFNKENNKILLFNVEDRDFYLLPGGRIEELEKSIDAIRREVNEELGKEYANLKYEYICTSEEFVNSNGYNNHQINIIYKAIYNKEIKEYTFHGLEGKWIKFKWIDIKEIDKISIYPSMIKEIIKGKNIKNIIEDKR